MFSSKRRKAAYIRGGLRRVTRAFKGLSIDQQVRGGWERGYFLVIKMKETIGRVVRLRDRGATVHDSTRT